MARRIRPVVLFAVAALLAAPPAFAQFGSIFGDPPPRPPADVPNAPPSHGRNRRHIIPAAATTPPSQPLPAPMNLPPSNRPGAGAVQSQPLPPPPGGLWRQRRRRVSAATGRYRAGPAAARLPPGPGSPRNAPQPANTAPQPSDEVVVEPPPQRITNPTAVFSGLDKITGRIISFDVAINETVQFGALQVTPRVCYSRPPTETPNTDAFVEVDEVTLQGEIKRIFTGWMFAASPGLHAVEHPIYDVWITDCKGGQSPNCRRSARMRRRSRRRARNSSNGRTATAARRRPPPQPQRAPPPPELLPAAGAAISSRTCAAEESSSASASPRIMLQRFSAAERRSGGTAVKSASPMQCFLQQPMIAPLRNFDGAEGPQVLGDILRVEQAVAAEP